MPANILHTPADFPFYFTDIKILFQTTYCIMERTKKDKKSGFFVTTSGVLVLFYPYFDSRNIETAGHTARS